MASCDKKLVKSKSGLRMVTFKNELKSPFTVNEPSWVKDSECLSCTSCKVSFDFFQRRHHCRRCGNCFCHTCCSERVPLPRMCFVDPVIHCTTCAVVSKKENEFFDSQIKILLQGVQLKMHSTVFEDERPGPIFVCIFCKLSSDHRNLLFDLLEPNPFISLEPLEIIKVKATKFTTSPNMMTGGTSIMGVHLQFADSTQQNQTIQLTVTEKGSQQQALAWLSALHKALKLVNLDKKSGSFSVLE